MGLFKKKLLPFPSKPSEKQEQINMDKFIADIPMPPSDFGNQPQSSQSSLQPPGVQQPINLETPPPFSLDNLQKELPPIDTPPLPEKELPSIDLPPTLQSAAPQPSPTIPAPPITPEQPPKETFDLPDFDDEEIKELETIKPAVKQEFERKPAERKPVYAEEIEYPEEEKKPLKQKDKYVAVSQFMLIKEEMEETRKIAGTTEESIEQHAAMINEKNEKYEALTEILNTIQEKLIIIDTKLFESH